MAIDLCKRVCDHCSGADLFQDDPAAGTDHIQLYLVPADGRDLAGDASKYLQEVDDFQRSFHDAFQ